MQSNGYTTEELMAAVISRELRDGETGFIGIGTGGRAFTLAVGIPMLACRLAQRRHAPDFIPILGPVIRPDLERAPESVSDSKLLSWPSSAHIAGHLDVFLRGKMDVGFVSAAQIDRYGNINIVSIGDYRKPKVRLVGCLAQTEHLAMAKRVIVIVDHSRRTFVEKVDFISGTGFLCGGDARRKAGLRGGGPKLVVTNLAVLGFDDVTKEMRLLSVHPGVSVSHVLSEMSFTPVVPQLVPETQPPSREELAIMREINQKANLLSGQAG